MNSLDLLAFGAEVVATAKGPSAHLMNPPRCPTQLTVASQGAAPCARYHPLARLQKNAGFPFHHPYAPPRSRAVPLAGAPAHLVASRTFPSHNLKPKTDVRSLPPRSFAPPRVPTMPMAMMKPGTGARRFPLPPQTTTSKPLPAPGTRHVPLPPPIASRQLPPNPVVRHHLMRPPPGPVEMALLSRKSASGPRRFPLRPPVPGARRLPLRTPAPGARLSPLPPPPPSHAYPLHSATARVTPPLKLPTTSKKRPLIMAMSLGGGQRTPAQQTPPLPQPKAPLMDPGHITTSPDVPTLVDPEPKAPAPKRRKKGAAVEVEEESANERQWRIRFKELVSYKSIFGHTVVSSGPSSQHKLLGKWVSRQRKECRAFSEGTKSKLTSERFEKLKTLDFDWHSDARRQVYDSSSRSPAAPPCEAKALSKDETWMKRFKELASFKAVHGHCFVSSYETSTHMLGAWVTRQRRLCRLMTEDKSCSMNKEQFELLESIDFNYSMDHKQAAYEISWRQRFSELKGYRALHGNCKVPFRYPTNPPLGNWVNRTHVEYNSIIREGKNSNFLTSERIQMLEDLGFFCFDPPEGRRKPRKDTADEHGVETTDA